MSITKFFDRMIQYILLIAIVLIICLSCLNIALRWFEIALTFVEPLVRHLVFFSSFMGAVLAIGSDRHIKIDLMQRFIQKRKFFKRIVSIFYFSIILSILLALTYSSYMFAKSEFEFGKIEFLGVHSGVLTSTIPLGFLLMAIRHILSLFDKKEASCN